MIIRLASIMTQDRLFNTLNLHNCRQCKVLLVKESAQFYSQASAKNLCANLVKWALRALVLCLLMSMLITIANILDPDQARQNVGPDLDPKTV